MQPNKPFKSVAIALLYTVFLGPIGLLYASFWGGIFMICLGFAFIIGHWFFLAFFGVWLGSCIWAVSAAERHNRNIIIEKK